MQWTKKPICFTDFIEQFKEKYELQWRSGRSMRTPQNFANIVTIQKFHYLTTPWLN
jgi:hypothetical protein